MATKTAAKNKTGPALERRLAALRGRMAAAGLDAYLLTHPPDICHVSGFSGHDSVAIVTPKRLYVATDSRYTEELDRDAPQAKLVLRKKSMADAIGGLFSTLRPKRVGFETNFVTFGTIDGLKRELRKLKVATALTPMSDMMVGLRKLKDSDEVGRIRTAVDIAEKAFLQLIPGIKPGTTESALTGRFILAMRELGASDAAFHPIIAAGANSSLPHYRPNETPIRDNAPLLVDWGAIYKDYRSDLTRTVFLGKPHKKLAEIYKIVLEANMAAIDKLKAGLNCKEADEIARKVITKAGYGKNFGHGLGHGIGRDIHEEPRLHFSRGKEHLEPGSVVTVEPGIYLPGIGGVRIEDDVLITDTGCEVLSSLPKSFDWACEIAK